MLLNRALFASLALFVVSLSVSVPAAALPPPVVGTEVEDDGAGEAESPLTGSLSVELDSQSADGENGEDGADVVGDEVTPDDNDFTLEELEAATAEDDPTEDDPTEDHPTEEVATEEVATEEVATEEVATEEVATEEVATEEAATEEAATEDVVVAQPQEAAAIEAVRFDEPPVVELAPIQGVERTQSAAPEIKLETALETAPESAPSLAAETPEPSKTPVPTPTPPPAPTPTRSKAKETMHELAIEIGWNAPAGWGFRYLFRIPNAPVSVGLGAGLLTMWGPKVSVLARWSPKVESGPFLQGSFALSGGSRGEADVPVALEGGGVSMEKASLIFTPGRTLDFVGGWRWAFGNGFVDVFGGYSVKLSGVALQDRTQTMVEFDETTRFVLDLMSPGGISWGATWGWRF